MSSKLVWEDKHSVGIDVIDRQHQVMFATINQLVDLLSSVPTKDQIS